MTLEVPVDSIDDAADALLARWTKKEDGTARVASGPDEIPDVVDDAVVEDTDGSAEDAAEEIDEGKPAAQLAPDDHEVEIDGQRVAVKDLKELFGERAAIEQRSQEAVQKAAKAEQDGTRANTAINGLLERAKAKWEPFSKIDFMVAQSALSTEEFAQLRVQAQAAYADVQYLEKELDAAVKEAGEKHHTALQEAAKNCVAVLTDPDKGIKGWDDAMYNEVRSYGVSSGLPQHVVDTIVEPAVIKLLHKAMLFDRGQKAAVVKLTKAPKNVNQSPANGGSTGGTDARARKSLDTLRRTGSKEDAAEALMARWAAAE